MFWPSICSTALEALESRSLNVTKNLTVGVFDPGVKNMFRMRCAAANCSSSRCDGFTDPGRHAHVAPDVSICFARWSVKNLSNRPSYPKTAPKSASCTSAGEFANGYLPEIKAVHAGTTCWL